VLDLAAGFTHIVADVTIKQHSLIDADRWDDKVVAITGISGFIGRHLAIRLLTLGATVRGIDLTIDESLADYPGELDCRVGSILDPSHDDWLLEDCDVLIHCAAVVEEDGSLDFFRKVNVGATVRLARKANHYGVDEFVQLSSIMVYGFNYRSHVTERGPLRGEGNPYCITKIESEGALEHILNADAHTRLTIIRPGDVFGPGSRPWVVRPASLMHRGIFALPRNGLGTMNAVYIENLVDAILIAAIGDHQGVSVFNVIDTHLQWREYFREMATAIDARKPVGLPATLMKVGFQVANKIGIDMGASASAIDFISREHPVSPARFRETFDYLPRIPFRQAMETTTEWLIENPDVWQSSRS
jgi:nucleoside-diphosphate-sugar epimerase